MEHLFVYGTLQKGQSNAHILEKIGGTWTEAFVIGKLYQIGWGANQGFPGLVLDETGDKIKGFIFSSENLSAYWAELDEFEGEEYQRVLRDVNLSEGEIQKAYLYSLNLSDVS